MLRVLFCYQNPKRGKIRQIDATVSSKNVVKIKSFTTKDFQQLFIPFTFNINNFHWHTYKLNIKFKAWFYFCTCIMNSETKLPTIIKIHLYCVITIRFKFNCYKSCRQIYDWNSNRRDFILGRFI